MSPGGGFWSASTGSETTGARRYARISPEPARLARGRFGLRRIDNSQTGEHMEFQLTAQESHGELLRIEFVLDPGGLVAGLHVHPHQEERLEVLAGTLRVRLGDVEHELHAGETLTV